MSSDSNGIYYARKSTMLCGLSLDIDKYGSKNTGIQTNIQAKFGGTYEQIIMDRVYIRLKYIYD